MVWPLSAVEAAAKVNSGTDDFRRFIFEIAQDPKRHEEALLFSFSHSSAPLHRRSPPGSLSGLRFPISSLSVRPDLQRFATYPVRKDSMKSLRLAGAAMLAALLLAGCGGSDDPPSATDRANAQADREREACFEQADQIAATAGADAGSAKLDQCVEQYSRDLQVAP